MPEILIISSQVHQELSEKQLDKALALVEQSPYACQVQKIDAGSYEIPFVINKIHQKNPFDGYLALGLVIKKDSDHFAWIDRHLSHCFSHFALSGIAIGNGILYGQSVEDLDASLESQDPCVAKHLSAFQALDFLIPFQNRA